MFFVNNYRIDKENPIALIALKTHRNIIRGARYINEADENSYVDIAYKKENEILANNFPHLPIIYFETNGLTDEEINMKHDGAIICVVVDDTGKKDETKTFVKYYRKPGYFYTADRTLNNLSVLLNGHNLREKLRIYRFIHNVIDFKENGPDIHLYAESFSDVEYLKNKIAGTFVENLVEITPLEQNCSLIDFHINEQSYILYDSDILEKSLSATDFDKILFAKNSTFTITHAVKNKSFFMPAIFCSSDVYCYENCLTSTLFFDDILTVKEAIIDSVCQVIDGTVIDVFINNINKDIQITADTNCLRIFMNLDCGEFPVNINEIAGQVLDVFNYCKIRDNLKKYGINFTSPKNVSVLVYGESIMASLFIE